MIMGEEDFPRQKTKGVARAGIYYVEYEKNVVISGGGLPFVKA